MSLNSDATLVPAAGNYLHGPVDTAFPTDLKAPGIAWEAFGHTSLEDILSTESEGGEATVLGTLQAKQLRTIYSARSEKFKFTVNQFDEDNLKMFFGSNMVDVEGDGSLLGVPSNPTPTIAAFLVIFFDGENAFAFYAPKAEIYRGDDLSIADTESLAGLPLSVTPVISGSNDWAYAVTPLGRVVTP